MKQSVVFDAHVHIFPDNVAPKAIPLLAERSGIQPAYDGTRAGLIAAMAAAGIHAAMNCPIATRPEQVESVNRWAAQHNQWPVFSLGSLHPDYPAPEKALQAVRNAGLRGIKLHPEYQEFSLDDPRMIPVWRTCRDLGLLVVIHAGADIAFQPPFHSAPADFRTLVETWPGLDVVAAHFGGWKMWDAVEAELIGAPVYLDLSFTLGLLPDERLVDMIRRHGVDRVLFGTDAPWRRPKAELEHLASLPLTSEEWRAICSANAERLFHIPPPPKS